MTKFEQFVGGGLVAVALLILWSFAYRWSGGF